MLGSFFGGGCFFFVISPEFTDYWNRNYCTYVHVVSRVLRVLTMEITALGQAISEFWSVQIKFYSSLFWGSVRYDNIL